MSPINYAIPDPNLPAKHYFHEILKSTGSCLLLPPYIRSEDAIIKDPPGVSGPYIGLFSSGTTGTPKCIWNSLINLQNNGRITAEAFGITSSHRLLIMAKPWHVAGFTWMLTARDKGCAYEFVTTKKGGEEEWLRTIQEVNPTHLLTVPAVLRSLYSLANWKAPVIVSGGSPVYTHDYNELKNHSDIFYQAYGQTEAGGLISCNSFELNSDITEQICYCYGIPPPEVKVRCKGSPKHPAPIFIKSPTAVQTGFYDTGDLGYLNVKGELFLAGRRKTRGG